MMKMRTKLEVKRRRPKRYVRRDAACMHLSVAVRDKTWFLFLSHVPFERTDAEEEESKQGDGMATEFPAQRSRGWRLLGGLHGQMLVIDRRFGLPWSCECSLVGG